MGSYPQLRGVSVLLVEDDPDARDLAAEVLRWEGMRVIEAGSAAEALDKFESSGVDLIVSDIGMPDMDGFQLLQRIGQVTPASRRRPRAIALTAYAGEADRQRALAAGYDVYLTKPFAAGDLLRACARLSSPVTAPDAVPGGRARPVVQENGQP